MPVSTGPRVLVEKYPPSAVFAKEWSESRKAIGATISPGQTYDLILEIHNDGSAGRLSGVVIGYESKGTDYVAQTHLSLILKDAPAC